MTATAALDNAFPEPGKVFAERFRVERLLGTGGHSRVYKARQQGFDRDVALKVLFVDRPVDLRTRDTIEKRFYREARLLSRLRGPNTLRVYDYGRTESGLLFMVSELVEGTDLAELLRTQGALSERRARRIFTQILQGLMEVHTEGFLHRDVKPSNIMVFDHLGERDRVKLLDFGIAKTMATVPQETALTMAGFVIGTPGYMSPEQARGDEMSEASDVFSAGLVAFEMLTGRAPYAGLSPEMLARSLRTGSIRLPGTLDVDPTFAQVVHRCLETEPSARYQTVALILRDLGIAPDTVELPVADRPRPASNVLTFPMHMDFAGTTTIDTLTDAQTGETTAIVLPDTGPTVPPPADATATFADDDEHVVERRRSAPLVLTLFLALVVVGLVTWLATRPDEGPKPAPPAVEVDLGPAIGAATDVVVRAARNAELDATIAAKEASLQEPPPMEFEEEKPLERPEPARKVKAEPAANDPPKKKPDFDVEMVDDL